MTQEEKDLLLRDLCARLPYGVVIKEEYGDYINVNLYNANLEHLIDRISEGLDKLVLRPMSSMTEEEWNDYQKIKMTDWVFGDVNGTFINAGLIVNWLLKNHFDFMSLIPKGLAIEVTGNTANL